MAIMNGTGFGQNNGGEAKKRTNFPIGKIRSEDGFMNIGIWNSDKGSTFVTINIKGAIGKDPSTGSVAYEQKMNGELPSAVINMECLQGTIMALKATKPEEANLKINYGKSSLTFVGSANGVKVTVESGKGTRSMTFAAMPVGPMNVYPAYELFIEYLKIGMSKMKFQKLDEDEFKNVIAASGENDADSPF